MGQTNHDQPLFQIVTLPLAPEIQDFLLDAEVRHLSPKTRKVYRHHLSAFAKFAKVDTTGDVTALHIRRYLKHLEDTGHNHGGVHQAYRTLKTFFTWLVREEVIDKSPIQNVRLGTPKENPLPPVPLPDLLALLATCDKSLTGFRDRSVLLALLDTGCRASEFVALDIGDLDMNTGAVQIRNGKGGKARTVFLGAKSRRAVSAYLRKRGWPETGALFATLTGGRLAYGGLRQIVRRRAEAAGVPVPALHSFRRAFALACLRNGVDLISLQRLMGHADLSVIRRYLAQTTDDLARAHAAGGPVDRLL